MPTKSKSPFKSSFKVSPWSTGANQKSGVGGGFAPQGQGFGQSKGVATTAAAAKPSGPAPWDTQYEQTKSSLNQSRDSRLTNLAADRSTLQTSYGYNLDGTENSSDPYSRLASLRADYEKIKRGSSANLAAQGMGYDGAFQNAVNQNQESQNRNLDSLKKDFQGQANSLRNQETEIWNEWSGGLTSAGNERIDRAASNVADGSSPVAVPNQRRDAVLSALSGKLSPSHRDRLRKEAMKNGWITA